VTDRTSCLAIEQQYYAFPLLQSVAQIIDQPQWHKEVVSILHSKSPIPASNQPPSTVAMLNYLPIIGLAAQLIAELLFSGLSDYFQTRLPFLLLHSVYHPLFTGTIHKS
jgi:hypothetical protein